MILEFATKRDASGNRYYLGINCEDKTFSRQRAHWYTRDDVVEISKKDRNKMIDQLEKAEFVEIDIM